MASLTVRQLDDELKKRLRLRAARNGRSMEDEVAHHPARRRRREIGAEHALRSANARRAGKVALEQAAPEPGDAPAPSASASCSSSAAASPPISRST